MILVGLDFQDDSWAALRQARTLSDATGMPVEVLHVWEYGQGDRWEPGPAEVKALEAVELSPADVRLRRGVPWVELVRYAKEQKARMVVVGRHGGSGFQPLALGSTAQRMATTSRGPVLLVSEAGEGKRTAGWTEAQEADAAEGFKRQPNGSPTASEAS